MAKHNDPFLYTSFVMADKGFMDIEGDVLITDKHGEVKKVKVGAKEKAIYFYLLGRISVSKLQRDGEYDINPSYTRIGKAMGGMDRGTVEKVIKNLKDMRMIDYTATDGKQHEYECFHLVQSRIMYDRKKPDGKYYHEEIKWYIEKIEQIKNNPVQSETPKKAKRNAKGMESVNHSRPDDYEVSAEDLKKYPMLLAST